MQKMDFCGMKSGISLIRLRADLMPDEEFSVLAQKTIFWPSNTAQSRVFLEMSMPT